RRSVVRNPRNSRATAREQRHRIAVPELRACAKPFVKRAANKADRPPPIRLRRSLRAGPWSLRRLRCTPLALPPVPTQSVIIDREFSRGSLDRCARCQETLDPHALNVIAALTPPGS